MRFMGLDFLDESTKAASQTEEKVAQKKAADNIEVYYTHAVDFKYVIVKGDLCYYTESTELSNAWNKNILYLRKQAAACNANCLIDVRIKVLARTDQSTNTIYTVYSTGVAVNIY